MCGIIGYIGNRNACNVLLDCLKRLEYRGYDSAGIGVIDKKINIIKEVGEISNLAIKITYIKGSVGIGHTRWATHGAVNHKNAHPHISNNKKISIVHNGIIENFKNLKENLKSKGYKFNTDTDSEVIAYLIEDEYFSPHDTAVISIPQKAPEGAIMRTESPFQLLERVKRVAQEWIKPGHRAGSNTHNVSATISLREHEWAAAGEWMWDNKKYYNGLSVLPYDGGTYKQAPFQDCTQEEYESEHIQNSIMIDFYSDSFKNELEKLDKNKTYLIYCRTGRRTGLTIDTMEELGFLQVYNMVGGITQWKINGYPIV